MPYGVSKASIDGVSYISNELKNLLISENAELILRPFPEYESSDTLSLSPSGELVKKIDLSRIYKIRFSERGDLNSVIKKLLRIPGVIFAEKIPRLQFMSTFPNDPYFDLQWGLHNTGQAGGTPDADIDAPEAWDIFRGTPSVKIGIIDAGVKADHEDLSGKVSGELEYTLAHGTHVAGIASAQTNNNIGVAGTDWYAMIHSEDISSFNPEEIYNDIVDAVDAGSDVLNNSWGGPDYSTLIRWAFHYAYEMNVVPIAAMGNDYMERVNWPAAFTCVVAVGATNNDDERSSYSTWGNHIDVVAPGGVNPYPYNDEHDIFSTWTGDPDYRFLAGTSMASPFVSGLASLLKGFRPDYTNDDIMWVIRISSEDINNASYPGWDVYTGYGRINVHIALKYSLLPYKIWHLSASGGTDYSVTDWYGMWFPMRPREEDQAGWRVRRHEVRKVVSLPRDDFIENRVWGRKESLGWSKGDSSTTWIQWEEGWCELVSQIGGEITLRTYVYEVQKVNLAGQPYGDIEWWPSIPSEVNFEYSVWGRSPLYAPASLTAYPVSESSIELSWYDNSDNEMGFLIYRSTDGNNFSILDTLWTYGIGVGPRTFVDTGLFFNTTYYYRIKAFAQEFSSDFSNTAYTVTNVLNSPSNLTYSTNSDYTVVTLSWQDNSDYETGYILMRKTLFIPGSEPGRIDTFYLPENSTFFIDTSVKQFSEYFYEIRAYADGGIISSEAGVRVITAATFEPLTENSFGFYNANTLIKRDNAYYGLIQKNDTLYMIKSTDEGITWTEEFICGTDDRITSFTISVSPEEIPYVVYTVETNHTGDIYFASKNGDIWTITHLEGEMHNHLTKSSMVITHDTAFIVFLKYPFSSNNGEIRVLAVPLLNPSSCFSQSLETNVSAEYVFPEIILWNDKPIVGYRSFYPSLWVKNLYGWEELYEIESLLPESEFLSIAGEEDKFYIGVKRNGVSKVSVFKIVGNVDSFDFNQLEDIEVSGFDRMDLFAGGGKIALYLRDGNGSKLFYSKGSNSFGKISLDGIDFQSISFKGVVWKSYLNFPQNLYPLGAGSQGILSNPAVIKWGDVINVLYLGIEDIPGGIKGVSKRWSRRLNPTATPLLSGTLEKSSRLPIFFKIEPNPTKGKLRIRFMVKKEISLTFDLYDVTGRKVYSKYWDKIESSAKCLELDLRKGIKMGSGVYFYQVKLGERRYRGKLLYLK